MMTATQTRPRISREPATPLSQFDEQAFDDTVFDEATRPVEVRPGGDSGFRVRHAITDQLGPASRRLEVETTAEAVIVSGRVASYYAKQLLTLAVQRAAEGRRVHNDTVVNAA